MNKEKARKSGTLRESFGYTINDILGQKPFMEIEGNRRLKLEGSRGVLLYSNTEIKVNMGDFTLRISGKNLYLKCISPTELTIEGIFENIEFCA